MKNLVMVFCAAALAATGMAETTGLPEGFKFGGMFGGPGFDNGVASYKGKPMVTLKECCVYAALSTNVPGAAVTDRFEYGRKGYFKATYLVLAANIVDIDFDGLVIESITDSAGKNYSKKKNGEPAWEVDEFLSSVNREAGVASFTITGLGNVWAKSLPKVKGKVAIQVADKMATKELAGKVSSGMIGTGDYSYKVKFASAFMSDEKNLEVSPAGAKSDCELEVLCGGKKLDSTGRMSMNGKTSYIFAKPESDDIVIKVTYPDGAKKLVLPFG